MKSLLVALGLISSACGTTSDPARRSAGRTEGGVTHHLEESDRHARAAEQHETKVQDGAAEKPTQPIQCLDDPLENVTSSGTERYHLIRPCWTSVVSPSDARRQEAQRHREEAAWHRHQAERLVAAEAAACSGLGEAEISQSPLTHAEDIVRVNEVREDGQLRGAHLVLRRVPGLTPAWLESSLECHRARAAALGYPPTFMSECPMMLPGVTARVQDERDGVGVILVADREEIAAAVLGRALDLYDRSR